MADQSSWKWIGRISLDLLVLFAIVIEITLVTFIIVGGFSKGRYIMEAWTLTICLLMTSVGVHNYHKLYLPEKTIFNELLIYPIIGPILCQHRVVQAKWITSSDNELENYVRRSEAIKLRQSESVYRGPAEAVFLLAMLMAGEYPQTRLFKTIIIIAIILCCISLADCHWQGIVSGHYNILAKSNNIEEEMTRPFNLRWHHKTLCFFHACSAIGFRIFMEGLLKTLYKGVLDECFVEGILAALLVEIMCRIVLHMLANLCRSCLPYSIFRFTRNCVYYGPEPSDENNCNNSNQENSESIHASLLYGVTATFTPFGYQAKSTSFVVWHYIENIAIFLLWFVFQCIENPQTISLFRGEYVIFLILVVTSVAMQFMINTFILSKRDPVSHFQELSVEQ